MIELFWFILIHQIINTMPYTASLHESLLNIINNRIQKHKDEIESFEMSDTSFINAKRTRYLGDLIRELEVVKSEYIKTLQNEL